MNTIPIKNEKYDIFWMCVCGLSNPACKAHAPHYIVFCGLSESKNIFPHYLINATIFGKKILIIKMCCDFLYYSVCLRRTERDIVINVHRSLCQLPVIIVRFNKTSIFSTYIRKTLKHQISQKSAYWKPNFFMRTE